MADAVVPRLTQLLTPVVAAGGHDLEGLEVTPAGRRRVVRIVVDRDGGVSLDQVADVSRAVSEALDEIDAREPALLGGAYVLEVSSPGVDRPLTEPRHWRRNVGRLVTATLADGSSETGRLTAADDTAVELGGRRVLLPELVRGKVQVEFNRPGGAGEPADAGDDLADADDDLTDADDDLSDADADDDELDDDGTDEDPPDDGDPADDDEPAQGDA